MMGISTSPKSKRADEFLCMRIPLRAKLKSNLNSLKSYLYPYPNLVLVSEGAELVYLAKIGGTDYCLFKFGASYLVEEVYSKASPVYLMRESILRFIGILAFIDEKYDVEFRGLFPYLASELSNPIPKTIVNKITAQSNYRVTELLLARRVTHLQGQLDQSNSKIQQLKEQNSLFLSHLLIKEAELGDTGVDQFLKKYSVGVSDLNYLGPYLSKLGYRALGVGTGRINLVKI